MNSHKMMRECVEWSADDICTKLDLDIPSRYLANSEFDFADPSWHLTAPPRGSTTSSSGYYSAPPSDIGIPSVVVKHGQGTTQRSLIASYNSTAATRSHLFPPALESDSLFLIEKSLFSYSDPPRLICLFQYCCCTSHDKRSTFLTDIPP